MQQVTLPAMLHSFHVRIVVPTMESILRYSCREAQAQNGASARLTTRLSGGGDVQSEIESGQPECRALCDVFSPLIRGASYLDDAAWRHSRLPSVLHVERRDPMRGSEEDDQEEQEAVDMTLKDR